MNIVLFISTVLIWGTSWIAIAFQVGDVPAVVSIFYRFAISGIIFILALAVLGKLVFPKRQDLPWIMLQACCLFSLNFICFYLAAGYITSGLIAVIFSLATLFNTLNARVFFGDRITPKVILACALGITGLVFLFGPDLFTKNNEEVLKGIALASLGTLFFSFGNMVSRHLSSRQVSPITANSWGMCLGAGVLLIIIQLTGIEISLPSHTSYWVALFYLAIAASVLGFTAYLMLLARIGSAQAAYTTVLFPIVALTISTFVEGYEWSVLSVFGLCLALGGNIVMFAKPKIKPVLTPGPVKP
ncbi:DMT family transporter [Terasakiella pusilla]|uniref:DMT family transporter n=1 Tax=Terasakiella pusilla TaxID=64973 RepID=UPI003AA93021